MTDPSGLQQLGARFYWPELGRFIQQDPIGDGVNWYAYVGNNPVMWVDPEGEVPVVAIAAGVVVVGGAAVWAWKHPDEAKAALNRAKEAIGEAARALWTGTEATMPVPSDDYGTLLERGGVTAGNIILDHQITSFWYEQALTADATTDYPKHFGPEQERWGRAAQRCLDEDDK